MAIITKLNTAWTTNLMEDATFEFRAVAENEYNNLIETVAKIDEIVARAVFANVDNEIKVEGQAIRTIINNAKAALDTHTAFLQWRQP